MLAGTLRIFLCLFLALFLINCQGGDTGVTTSDSSNGEVSDLSSGDITTALEVIEVGPGDGRPPAAATALPIDRECFSTNDLGKISELRFSYAFADFPGLKFAEFVLEENGIKTLLYVEFPVDTYTFDFLGAGIAINVDLNKVSSEGDLTTIEYSYNGSPVTDEMNCAGN